MSNNSHLNPDCLRDECEIIFDNITDSTRMMATIEKQSYTERNLGYVLIGIIGVVSNLFVIIVLGSSAKIRQKIVNTLIIHQSVVDFLASAALIGPSHLDGSKPHGLEGLQANIYCVFVLTKFPLWVFMYTSSFALVFLNIERYMSIAFPVYHHTNVTRKNVIKLLPIPWILGLLEQVIGGFAVSGRSGVCTFGASQFESKVSLIMGIVFLLAHFFLPILLVTFLYGHMMIQLKTSKRSNDDGTTSRRDNIMERAKKNIFKTMLIITICYAICYVFNSIYAVLLLTGVEEILDGK